MATVRFISKRPAGGAGNFIYTYACTCSSGTPARNITITAANDNEAQMLAEMECDGYCGETKKAESVILELEIPRLETPESNAQIIQNEAVAARSATNYSFYNKVYWVGDKLYGTWATTLSGVCAGQGLFAYVNQIQIISGPDAVGTCSGQYVVKIENTL